MGFPLSERETAQVQRANESGKQPVVFDSEVDHAVPWAIPNASYKRQAATRA